MRWLELCCTCESSLVESISASSFVCVASSGRVCHGVMPPNPYPWQESSALSTIFNTSTHPSVSEKATQPLLVFILLVVIILIQLALVAVLCACCYGGQFNLNFVLCCCSGNWSRDVHNYADPNQAAEAVAAVATATAPKSNAPALVNSNKGKTTKK